MTIVKLNQGGSGFGISLWKQVLSCPLQAHYDSEVIDGAREGPQSAETDDTLIGTLFHKFQELYHKKSTARGFDTTTVTFRQMAPRPWNKPDVVRATAEDLFRAYRVIYPPDYFGKVVAREKHYKMPLKKRPWWAPKSMPLTCQIDMEVKLGKESASKIVADHGLVVTPGGYLIDWKTAGSDWPNLGWQHVLELQFPFYMMMHKHMNPTKKISGLIVVAAFKRTKKFKMFLIQPPDENAQKMISELLSAAWDIYRDENPKGNPLNCFAYGRPCIWMVNGTCNRRALEV